MQGFTAAQLSTEPVGKILAEEPAAGGIDIEYQVGEEGSPRWLVVWVFYFVCLFTIYTIPSYWKPARQEIWNLSRRSSTCILTLSIVGISMVSRRS